MKNSVQPMNLLNRNGVQRYISGLARRIVLLVSFFVVGLGSVWGQEYDEPIEQILSETDQNNPKLTLRSNEYYKIEGSLIEFHFKANNNYNVGDNVCQLMEGNWNEGYGKFDIKADSYVGSGDNFTIIYYLSEIKNFFNSELTYFVFNRWDSKLATPTKVTVKVPKSDPFLNTAKNGVSPKSVISDPLIDKGQDTGTGTFKLSDIHDLSDIKYARIYVTDANGAKLEYNANNLLQVSGGQKAGESAKNGVYVYNNGDNLILEDITATLNAGVGNLNKYRIVILLSKDEATTDDSGKVTKEPQWDYEYTYVFTYLVKTEEIHVTLDESVLESSSVQLNSFSELNQYVPNYRNKWYARWYVKDASGKEQTIGKGSGSFWALTHYWSDGATWPSDRWVNDGDYMLWSDHSVNNGKDNDFLSFNFLISTPNNGKLENYSGYQIVFEITDEHEFPCTQHNDWGNPTALPPVIPAIKLRYIIEIPKGDNFLGKAKESFDPEKDADGDGEEIDREQKSASFTLDKAQKAPDNIKYARIILCDAFGNALDDQSVLKVTYNGQNALQAGKKEKNGVYIYDDGSPLTMSSVNITLNAGAGEMTRYRIKCLLSTGEMTGSADGGDLKEPDWDYEYTYRFTYPSRGQFEAMNINSVKTKHKTAVYDTSSRKTTIRLFSNWNEVIGDCNVSKGGFRDAYARWYLTDAEGNVISGIKDLTNGYNILGDNNGYYRQDFNPDNFREGGATTENGKLYSNDSHEWDYQGYNPTIELTTAANEKYSDVRVVCVVTTLLDEMELPAQEPEIMQVKYVYTLKTKTELEDAPFAHYVGESRRNYKEVSGTPGITEYSWNYQTGQIEQVSGNIRQDVHQTDYYIYIDPSKTNSNTPDADNLLLTLPIEDWIYTPVEPATQDENPVVRSSTEPLSYFRWYDWNKDEISPYLDLYKVKDNRKYDDESNNNDYKSKLETKDYGLVALMLDANSYDSYRDEIGVVFNNKGLEALKNLEEGDEIVIACDVSRYMDGIVLDGDSYFWEVPVPLRNKTDRRGQIHKNKYLVHEPTLSMRYIFHILPAKKIAKDIEDAAEMLNKVVTSNDDADKWENLGVESRSKVFQTYEDNGWVVVPVDGKFSLRVDLQDLNQYFINNNGTFVQCNNLQWYCYYVDENDLWKKKVNMEERKAQRLAKYEASEFSGTYTKVGASGTHTISVGNATQLHLVGYLGNGTIEQPVVHYGLEFTNQGPVKLEDIKEAQKDYQKNVSNSKSYRTDAYMHEHLTHGSTLNFDDFFTEATRYDKPMTSHENYADNPMVFENAQYGYSYPQLYGQCASSWQIYHGGWWNGYGIAPTHSDYTLLKTMNVPGVSASETYENQSIYTYWYDPEHRPLYDITHENDNSKYGTYLYIDAADEARTIAHLEFDASLCANSEIFYTAYVANMTPLTSTPPQVMFRVSTDVKDETTKEIKRIPVVSFLTGDIQSQGANQTAVWYQVYGSTKIPKELEHIANGEPRKYYVAIDNYCEDTKGADYTIDQISFFTTTAKVQILQSSTPCDESSGIEVAILAKASDLKDYAHEGDALYYRIFKKNSEGVFAVADAVMGDGIYNGGDGFHYGSVNFFENTLEVKDAESSLGQGKIGYYYNDGEWYFQFDRREFDLEVDATYFVSFYEHVNTTPDTDEENPTFRGWGNPYSDGACNTMYSNDITPRMLRIDFKEPDDSDYDGAIKIPCDVSEAVKNFTITVQYPTSDGGYSANTVLFDYYIGAKKDFKAIKNANGLYLEKALERFRANYPKGEYTRENLPEPVAGSEYGEGKEYTKEMYDLIMEHIGKLRLLATSEFNYTFTAAGRYRFAAIPVVRETDDGDICSPLEFIFDVEKAAGGPQLALGFSDVDYNGHGDTRVVRVGLEQLDNVKAVSGTYTLHIPVHSFECKNKDKSDNSIVFYGNDLVLWSTDDPTNTISGDKPVVATLQNDAGNKRPIVNRDHQYIAVKFNDDFKFHEGYQYELHTVYYDLGDDENDKPSAEACATNDLTFIIKVVPKYVTWNDGKVTEKENKNKNWNNDGNWSRSKKAELYSSSYKNNTEIDNRLTSTPATFVPMKFTYVTIPTGNKAPKLVDLKRGEVVNKNNGIYTNINAVEGENDESNKATDDIEYDLMVRYSLVSGDKQDECLEHGIKGKVYDCEKFYGNWAKEIYFKPGAELINQHYLTYQKAWVEKELTANRWYLMSSPLKETYAGDMYVPATPIKDYSLTPSTDVTGRQVTEAFQAIKMTDDQGDLLNLYSRTKYPIYQRSWGMKDGTVYTQKADTYRSDYNANLNYTEWKGNIAEWGHTFNDVDVPYTTRSGFSIRAHKQDQTEKALIRLPKDDTNYVYYDYNGNKQNDATSALTKTSADIGQFVTKKDDANIALKISDAQQMGGYVLVGNPYVASLDMAKFFTTNKAVINDAYYYVYEEKDDVYQAVTHSSSGKIRPLEAFFVKTKSDIADNAEITFTADMMMDGNYGTPTTVSNPVRPMTMTAANTRGQSAANVSVGEEAKNVETLFDSNLDDVPMVYTVADGQAVSINQVTELSKPIAFGVTCAATNEPVTVTFSDIEQLTSGEVYVVDAVTGEQTAIAEGSTLTVQPNDYGRYFLLAGALNIDGSVNVQQGIVVSVRGRVVTVTSGEVLTEVRALSPDGVTAQQATAGSKTASLTLATPGVYIIKAVNVTGEQLTAKVMVKAE